MMWYRAPKSWPTTSGVAEPGARGPLGAVGDSAVVPAPVPVTDSGDGVRTPVAVGESEADVETPMVSGTAPPRIVADSEPIDRPQTGQWP